MKRIRVALVVVLFSLASVGCRQVVAPRRAMGSAGPEQTRGKSTGPREATPASQLGSEVVIGHLKTCDKRITIRMGGSRLLYTVKSEDGTVLATDVTEEELAATFPALKDMVEGGIADWAGLDSGRGTSVSPRELELMDIYYSPRTRTTSMEHNNDLQPTK